MITKVIENTRYKYEEPKDWEIRETVKNLWTAKLEMDGISEIDRKAMEHVLLFLDKNIDPPRVVKDISNNLLEDEITACFHQGLDDLAAELCVKCFFRADEKIPVSEATKKARNILDEDSRITQTLQDQKARLMAPKEL